jgi:hypothetical protein
MFQSHHIRMISLSQEQRTDPLIVLHRSCRGEFCPKADLIRAYCGHIWACNTGQRWSSVVNTGCRKTLAIIVLWPRLLGAGDGNRTRVLSLGSVVHSNFPSAKSLSRVCSNCRIIPPGAFGCASGTQIRRSKSQILSRELFARTSRNLLPMYSRSRKERARVRSGVSTSQPSAQCEKDGRCS